ncbi:MAG TPA: methyl-accepting chemotaxis protein, partial [Pseudolabrys sp.]|nr:methyl-accepting chemotaxis protein [Pseudolabrys sp.]
MAAISVRTRIVVLAIIPAAGLLINGVTYIGGENEVARAFRTVKRANELADASRDFKAAVTSMRIVVKDFGVHPSQELVSDFHKQQMLALNSLETITGSISTDHVATISALRTDLGRLTDTFSKLVESQTKLGFDETSGLRGNLHETGSAVERIINENMTWLDPDAARKLMVALLAMRNYEIEYRLEPAELTRQQFQNAFKKFNETFGDIDGTPAMKVALDRQVKAYAFTFAQWIKGFDAVHPLRAEIDFDSQNMLPAADSIIARARKTAESASALLATAQVRTRDWILLIGIITAVLGLALSFMIVLSITRPLNGLVSAMKRLAEGNTAAKIPATAARDEIGAMARTVIVFRDNMIERERLAAVESEQNDAREQRATTISMTIAQFKNSIETVLGKLRAAALKLEMSSDDLNKAADTVSTETGAAERRVSAASENVTAAAGS